MNNSWRSTVYNFAATFLLQKQNIADHACPSHYLPHTPLGLWFSCVGFNEIVISALIIFFLACSSCFVVFWEMLFRGEIITKEKAVQNQIFIFSKDLGNRGLLSTLPDYPVPINREGKRKLAGKGKDLLLLCHLALC